MSDSSFLKCSCSYCQGHIEFPAHAAGITVTCPHCGVETRLAVTEGAPVAVAPPPPPPPPRPAAAPPPPPAPAVPLLPAAPATQIIPLSADSGGAKLRKVLRVTWSVLVGIVVVGLISYKVWSKYRKVERAVQTTKGQPKPQPPRPAAEASSSAAPMPPPVAPATSVVLAKGTPPPRQPGEDLQILHFEVQKAKDGNLQYVIGVVTNHSAKQYFNVKLEFQVTRKDGKAGEVAADSIRNLPGNAGMTFKASIIGTAPVTGAMLAKLAGEKE